MEKVLITGSAGFIGYFLATKMIKEGFNVIGIDNINDYYSKILKLDRLKQVGIEGNDISWNKIVKSTKYPNYRFIRLNLEESKFLLDLFESERFSFIIHLAAQAGVRYSVINPWAYIQSNLTGFMSILEACRYFCPDHLIFASSSSVYGMNSKLPFSVNDNVDHPISLYAATKKANELLAHSYSYNFHIPVTGLRFFTVYGPWGRPDMALHIFTEAIIQNRPIEIYNFGNMRRDFTYIDDIIESIFRLIRIPPIPVKVGSIQLSPATSYAPYRILNIGNNSPVNLLEFLAVIETKLKKISIKKFKEIPIGDVPVTWAEVEQLFNLTKYRPETSIQEGIGNFIDWYLSYYTQDT